MVRAGLPGPARSQSGWSPAQAPLPLPQPVPHAPTTLPSFPLPPSILHKSKPTTHPPHAVILTHGQLMPPPSGSWLFHIHWPQTHLPHTDNTMEPWGGTGVTPLTPSLLSLGWRAEMWAPGKPPNVPKAQEHLLARTFAPGLTPICPKMARPVWR